MSHGKWLLAAVCVMAAATVGTSTQKTEHEETKPHDKDNETGSHEDGSTRISNDFYQEPNPQPPSGADYSADAGYPYQPAAAPDYSPHDPPDSYHPPDYDNSSYAYDPEYQTRKRYKNHFRRIKIRYPYLIEKTRYPKSDPCGAPQPTCTCNDMPYRTYDGTCNNLAHGGWGSAGWPFSRVLPPNYANDEGGIVYRTASGSLPLARVLSETLFLDKNRPDKKLTLAVITWGQLVAHDLSLSMPYSGPNGEPIKCCTDDGQMLPRDQRNPNCIPIVIPKDDPFYGMFHRRCMNMVRAQILPQDGCDGPRQPHQISLATHYLDCSFIYGNSLEETLNLRTLQGGQLKMKSLRKQFGGRPRTFLPDVDEPEKLCDVKSSYEPCYMAGDPRVNENPGLAVLQTLMSREHNRLSRALEDMHPYWSDKILYEEARKILIAQWQHITMEYWLVKVIGWRRMKQIGLFLSEGHSSDYDPYMDPSTLNEFTAGAYRFMHSGIPGYFDLDNEGRCPFRSERLSDFFNKPGLIEKGDYFDSIFRGSITQASQEGDRFFTKEITKYLFKPTKSFGDDLESIDIQRGRDHGLPPYNEMRYMCGLPRAVNFEDFRDVMTEDNVLRLQNMYRVVSDVDLFVGGSLEDPRALGDYDAIVGPTFACIIAEQFYRIKWSDRYFFDLGGTPGSLTLDQVRAIKNANFSSMLCANMDYLKYVQTDVFDQVYPGNELMHCKEIPKLDLTPWMNYQPRQTQCSNGSGPWPNNYE